MSSATVCHVLVADDEPHIGRIIKMKLEARPLPASRWPMTGREALEVLEREPDICLVLLDLMMPHLSGLDVLSAMRADDRWRTLPTIILTAAGQEQQHTSAMQLGANDFLTKPFRPPSDSTPVPLSSSASLPTNPLETTHDALGRGARGRGGLSLLAAEHANSSKTTPSLGDERALARGSGRAVEPDRAAGTSSDTHE